MNKALLKKIEKLHGEASAALGEMAQELTDFAEALQEKFYNRSEKWQESDKGEAARERIENIESLRDEVQGALDGIEYVDFSSISPEE